MRYPHHTALGPINTTAGDREGISTRYQLTSIVAHRTATVNSLSRRSLTRLPWKPTSQNNNTVSSNLYFASSYLRRTLVSCRYLSKCLTRRRRPRFVLRVGERRKFRVSRGTNHGDLCHLRLFVRRLRYIEDVYPGSRLLPFDASLPEARFVLVRRNGALGPMRGQPTGRGKFAEMLRLSHRFGERR